MQVRSWLTSLLVESAVNNGSEGQDEDLQPFLEGAAAGLQNAVNGCLEQIGCCN